MFLIAAYGRYNHPYVWVSGQCNSCRVGGVMRYLNDVRNYMELCVHSRQMKLLCIFT